MFKELICKIFGHQDFKQSHRYDYVDEPYISLRCYRCGRSYMEKIIGGIRWKI